jgi:hypothetical protein
MNDNIDMETSKQPSGAEKPGPKDQVSKEAEDPLKKKTSPPQVKDTKDEAPDKPSEEEEPGTFDRVYEHGRQMGF